MIFTWAVLDGEGLVQAQVNFFHNVKNSLTSNVRTVQTSYLNWQ